MFFRVRIVILRMLLVLGVHSSLAFVVRGILPVHALAATARLLFAAAAVLLVDALAAAASSVVHALASSSIASFVAMAALGTRSCLFGGRLLAAATRRRFAILDALASFAVRGRHRPTSACFGVAHGTNTPFCYW